MIVESLSITDTRIRIKGDIIFLKPFLEEIRLISPKALIEINKKSRYVIITNFSKEEYKELKDFIEKLLKDFINSYDKICLRDVHPFISRTIKSQPLKYGLYVFDFGFKVGSLRYFWTGIIFDSFITKFL